MIGLGTVLCLPACLLNRTRDPTGGLLRRTLLSPVLISSQSEHSAVSRSDCLGAVPLKVTSVTTSITGPVGTCVVVRDWSRRCLLAETGSVPFLLATCAGESSACTDVVKVALVALGEISPVRFLGCYGVDRYSSIGSNAVLPLGWCLRGYLPVVVVVAVVVPVLPLGLFAAEFRSWDHRPLSDRLIGQAYRHVLGALIRKTYIRFEGKSCDNIFMKYLGFNKPSDHGQFCDGETQTRASHRISHDPKGYAALGVSNRDYVLRKPLSVYPVVYQIHTQLYDGQSLVNRSDQSLLSPNSSILFPRIPITYSLEFNKPSDHVQFRDGETQTRASHRTVHYPKDYLAPGIGSCSVFTSIEPLPSLITL
ncbi:hypothetical protein LXL04_022831 [Taraxacum kok-saghyz]